VSFTLWNPCQAPSVSMTWQCGCFSTSTYLIPTPLFPGMVIPVCWINNGGCGR
jgi:hypothetical protein